MAEAIPVQKAALHCPPLEEVAKVLQEGLQKNFADVKVSVVDCPDLTQKPYMLASKGLCGKPRLADIGGVPYLVPLAQKKIFDLSKVPEWTEVPDAFMVGAGAGPRHVEGINCEMMANLQVKHDNGSTKVNNNTHICKIDPKDGSYILKRLEGTTDCCLLMNLFVSEGKTGKVLEVKAGRRTGEQNYMLCLRKTLEAHYGTQPVGMGGMFLVEKGKVKIHVMPDYSEVPLESDEAVDNWLKFYEMDAPMVCLGYVMSHDPDLDLRIEHFHGFSDHGDGGHYHYDTTPDEVQYTGYFNIGEFMYRVDRPRTTHMIGRD